MVRGPFEKIFKKSRAGRGDKLEEGELRDQTKLRTNMKAKANVKVKAKFKLPPTFRAWQTQGTSCPRTSCSAPGKYRHA